jgi:hypothetical protein
MDQVQSSSAPRQRAPSQRLMISGTSRACAVREVVGRNFVRGTCDGTVRDAARQPAAIDFGDRLVDLSGRKARLFQFVAHPRLARRTHVRPFL